MGNAILVLTDGTERIDMLNVLAGFSVADWRQAVAALKGGGTWQSSSLSGGRQLVDARYDNIQESFPIQVVDQATQDNAIRVLQDFFRLSIKAQEYWTTDWQSEPVWIESRAEHETNTRKAMVYTSTVPDLTDIYSPTFKKSATLPALTWSVERGHWGENVPGVGTAVELSAVEAYDGRNLGNVDSSGDRDPTTADEVYIANKRNTANITDIYTWSAANGWSANLMDAALPFDLIDDVGVAPQVNDYIAFGIDTTLADSGPFCSLVFDIGTAGAGYTGHWEYWSSVGPGWATLRPKDNTDANGAMTGAAFDTLGVNSVHWRQDDITWITNALNGITGYWVRWVIDTLPGGFVTPAQQSRDIYTIVWPYVEIQSGQVEGDIPALMLVRGSNEAYRDVPPPDLVSLPISIVLCCLRSMSRGEDFTAYINATNKQNPAGITITTGADTAFADDVSTPSGRKMVCTFAVTLPLTARLFITFTPAMAAHFRGQFRLYLRMRQVGGSDNDVGVCIKLLDADYNVLFTTVTNYMSAGIGTVWNLKDFGIINLPDILMTNQEFSEMRLHIFASAVNATPNLEIMDMILMPVDEYAFYVRGDSAIEDEYFFVDSVEYPKQYIRALVKDVSTDYIQKSWRVITNGQAILQANAKQRLWFNCYENVPYHGIAVQAQRNQRYLGPRGAR